MHSTELPGWVIAFMVRGSLGASCVATFGVPWFKSAEFAGSVVSMQAVCPIWSQHVNNYFRRSAIFLRAKHGTIWSHRSLSQGQNGRKRDNRRPLRLGPFTRPFTPVNGGPFTPCQSDTSHDINTLTPWQKTVHEARVKRASVPINGRVDTDWTGG
jgi:hypothetical protein